MPSVTVVFLVYNRQEELRRSLTKTLELDYDHGRLDVIVVDNASADGSAEMVRRDFPHVRVIRRSSNAGVSGWNDGFDAATGDYVLALDDDCHLPPDGLRRAVAEAREQRADLVSFGVVSSKDGAHRFDLEELRTGLLSFWGCAVLMRREALRELGGYDPAIFVWANELEFMLRFFDRGFRHLHLPEVVAVHERGPAWGPAGSIPERGYRANARNVGYIAGKLLRRGDAAGALVALVSRNVRDGVRMDRVAFKGVLDTLSGFARGLRQRQPVRREVSRAYRRNFETFANPWSASRTLRERVRDALGRPARGPSGRRERWLAERSRFYPERRGVLEL